MAPLSKNFDFKLRRDHQKIFYERCDYVSVDEKAYLRPCPEKRENVNSGGKRLKKIHRKAEVWNICLE